MFIPQIPCKISRVGSTDVYGQSVESIEFDEMCHIVRLRKSFQHSSVRADSSASRGHTDEDRADVIVLLKPNSQAQLGDRLTVGHVSVRINNVNPRYSVMGLLHHLEVKGQIWD